MGRAQAVLFAAEGAAVCVADINDEKGQAVVDEIQAAGGEAVANTDSVATPEGGAAIVQSAVDAFGTVDIVINNAGILRDKSFAKMEDAQFDAVIDVVGGPGFQGQVDRVAAEIFAAGAPDLVLVNGLYPAIDGAPAATCFSVREVACM